MSVKNQHYIPQFYLRAFSLGRKKKKRQLWQYSKSNGEKKLDLVKNIASKEFFYELPNYIQQAYIQKFGEDDNFNLVEDMLSKYEHMFSKFFMDLLKELKSTKDLSSFLMNHSSRLWISFFIVVQFYRTPKWRQLKAQEYMRENTKVNKPISNIIKDWEHHKLREGVALNKSLLDQQLYFIGREGLEKLNVEVNFIGNCLWSVGENISSIPFVTSDSPVVKYTGIFFNGFELNGLFLPLTEKYVLIIVETEILRTDMANVSNKVIEVQEKEVRFMNNLQLKESYDFIYSSKQELNTFV
jgi:hypothetical protein